MVLSAVGSTTGCAAALSRGEGWGAVLLTVEVAYPARQAPGPTATRLSLWDGPEIGAGC
ncbi:MAG: hypothetical protein ACJA0P_003915 [Planctomycetota bacterium]|jgi:hypothetical protein